MRSVIFWIFALLILHSLVSAAAATTLYIAASDSNAASRAAANYTCDGVNDQIEIQNALNSLGLAGGEVVLSEGTFTATGPIQIPAHTTLIGAGADNTLLKFSNNGYISILNDYVTVDGFKVTGSGYTSYTTHYGGLIYDYGASHIRINNIVATADNTIQAVFFIHQINEKTIEDIEFNNDKSIDAGTYAFLFSSWSSTNKLIKNVQLIDCQASNSGKYSQYNDWVTGFDFAEQNDIQNLTAIRCIADGSWESGFHLEGPPVKQNVTLIDCKSRNNGQKEKTGRGKALYGAGFMVSEGMTLVNCSSENNIIGFRIISGGRLIGCHDQGSEFGYMDMNNNLLNEPQIFCSTEVSVSSITGAPGPAGLISLMLVNFPFSSLIQSIFHTLIRIITGNGMIMNSSLAGDVSITGNDTGSWRTGINNCTPGEIKVQNISVLCTDLPAIQCWVGDP